jgi:hypothetical protein
LKRGPHPAETFAALAAGELRSIKTSNLIAPNVIEEKYVPAQELGEAMLSGYVDHYGEDDHMYVIEPERSGQVDIRDPDFPEQMLAIYAFTYDLIWRNLKDDSIWLEEHKTAKTIRTTHLPLDPQAGSYWAVAGPHLRQEKLIGPKERLAGIQYNFLRKALPDTRPVNADGYYTNKPTKDDYIAALAEAGINTVEQSGKKSGPIAIDKALLRDLEVAARYGCLEVFGEVSKQQPAPLFVREDVNRTAHEQATQIRSIQDEALLMRAYREGELPITKNRTQDCPFCQYFDMCVLDEGSGDAAEYRRAMYVVKDPYADHRKSTEE